MVFRSTDCDLRKWKTKQIRRIARQPFMSVPIIPAPACQMINQSRQSCRRQLQTDRARSPADYLGRPPMQGDRHHLGTCGSTLALYRSAASDPAPKPDSSGREQAPAAHPGPSRALARRARSGPPRRQPAVFLTLVIENLPMWTTVCVELRRVRGECATNRPQNDRLRHWHQPARLSMTTQ